MLMGLLFLVRTIFAMIGLPLQVGHRAHERLLRLLEVSHTFVGGCGADCTLGFDFGNLSTTRFKKLYFL